VIVDCHVHVVSSDETRYPLRPAGVGSDWFRTSPVDVDGLTSTMRGAGVDGAVLVQAFGAYSTDNAYVLDAAVVSGLPAVVIVDDADHLRRLAARHPEVRGVRLFALGRGMRLDDDAGWRAARDLGLPVVVVTFADGLPTLATMLRRFDDVAVALDHCAFVDDAAALTPLKPFENLHLKVTAHVEVGLEQLCDMFGPHRLLWGSDFPQLHDRPYGELVARARERCAALDVDARAAFLGGNARRLWPAL